MVTPVKGIVLLGKFSGDEKIEVGSLGSLRATQTTFYPCPERPGHLMPSCAVRWLNRLMTMAHSLQTVLFENPRAGRASSTSDLMRSSLKGEWVNPWPVWSLLRAHECSFRDNALLQETPERDEQAPSQSHDSNSSGSGTSRKPRAVPSSQSALRLVPQPAPRQLNQQSPQAAASGFPDSLVAL